jgi:microsomal dipeptidase-like Zn-dependent dipeptidase
MTVQQKIRSVEIPAQRRAVTLLARAEAGSARVWLEHRAPNAPCFNDARGVRHCGDRTAVGAQTITGQEWVRVVLDMSLVPRGRTASIVIEPSSGGRLDVDDVAYTDSPAAAGRIDAPVWGFADLHSHPAAHLGFGGRLFWGTPTDSLDVISTCDGMGHGSTNGPPLPAVATAGAISRTLLCNLEAPFGTRDSTCDSQQFFVTLLSQPDHYASDQPHFYTRTHQQMHETWIRRAYDGGLRLAVWLAVNNGLLGSKMGDSIDASRVIPGPCSARASLVSSPDPKKPGGCAAPKDDARSVDLQIQWMQQFAQRNSSWMEIARTPKQARAIIERNKLAVVMGIEVDQLGQLQPFGDGNDNVSRAQPTAAQIQQEIARVYRLGVRAITPLHLVDNFVGGAAIYNDLFDSLSRYATGQFYCVEDGSPDGIGFELASVQHALDPGAAGTGKRDFTPADVARLRQAGKGMKNCRGLTAEGRVLLDEMKKRGMIIDLDHMGQNTMNGLLGWANANRYPAIVSSHTDIRDFTDARHKNESQKTLAAIAQIAALGGMVSPVARQEHMDDARSLAGVTSVQNDCKGTSKSWALSYAAAVRAMNGRGVSISTDMDGFPEEPGPRFSSGTGGCELGGNKQAQSLAVRYVGYSPSDCLYGRCALHVPWGGNPPMTMSTGAGGKRYDVNLVGLAHYGLLPDFVQDAKNVGLRADQMTTLFRSADDYIRMWEAACSHADPATRGLGCE